MEKVGILVVAYGARENAIIDKLLSSPNYDVKVYCLDRQNNPFNRKRCEKHFVSRSLELNEILKLIRKYRERIDLVDVPCEKPIVEGVRDEIEERFGIPVLCPTKGYALEKSKALQRELMQKYVPEVCPRFKVFDPRKLGKEDARKEVESWLEELGGVKNAVLKPDKPGYGKGVLVGGEHLFDEEEFLREFYSIFGRGEKVLVEEKVEGVEFSLQCYCDGKRLEILPAVQDHKRAFDGDRGPNTGGMGSVKDVGEYLPYMEREDWKKAKEATRKFFEKIRGRKRNEGLLGMPFYWAFVCANDGTKAFEINSRPGDPEIMNVLPIMDNDLAEFYLRLVDGKMPKVKLKEKATVVTYLVPLDYGGYLREYTGDRRIRLEKLLKYAEENEGNVKVYFGSVEERAGKVYAGKSRSVAVVGIGDSIEEARKLSLEGIKLVDGPLRYRCDIGARDKMLKDVAKVKVLRGREVCDTELRSMLRAL